MRLCCGRLGEVEAEPVRLRQISETETSSVTLSQSE